MNITKTISRIKFKQLVNQFEVIDYTVEKNKVSKKIFCNRFDNRKFFSTKLYLTIAKYFYFLIPTYLLLKKSESE
ncbi:hypothetical protein CM15mP35_00310 [bacterium]|nr:MAG: hypothetical protein CM15mP35_00310 [bacterium]